MDPLLARRFRSDAGSFSARLVASGVKNPDVDKIVAALLQIIKDENRKDKQTKRKRAA